MTTCKEQIGKGCVHFGMANLATAMCLYNGLAWVTRREPRLAVNALIYAAILAFETYHTRSHWSQPRAVPPIDVNARRA